MSELGNLEAICGNPDRARVILASVRELVRNEQQITTAAIDAQCFALPHWTACEDDEAAAAFTVVEAEAEQHAAKLEAEAAATEQATVKDADSHVPEPEAPTPEPAEVGDRDAALANVNRLTRELGDARSAYTVAGDKLRKLRAAAAKAIECWQRGLPSTSFREALDAVSLTQRLTKQQTMDRTVPGPSAWDRQAFYSTGRGSAPAFVQKRMRGGGNRRGSLPLNMARGPLDTEGKSKTPLRRTVTS